MRELPSEERDYSRILAEFAFRNPFEKKSVALAYKVAGGKYPVGPHLSNQIFEAVGKRIERITSNGKTNWKHFSGEDRELVRVALLHDSYYRCFSRFDDLILQHIKATLSDYPVSFAQETLQLLCGRGFSFEESLRYFGFYYQLRRAWYFINHGLIGTSASMEVLRSHLWRSVFTSFPDLYERVLWDRMEDFSTFLVGETGTGKGTAAAAIGRSGFIPFNDKKGCFVESFTSNFIEINYTGLSKGNLLMPTISWLAIVAYSTISMAPLRKLQKLRTLIPVQ